MRTKRRKTSQVKALSFKKYFGKRAWDPELTERPVTEAVVENTQENTSSEEPQESKN